MTKTEIVEKAFNKVKGLFNAKVTCNSIEAIRDDAVRIYYNDPIHEQVSAWSFGSYWFNKKEWSETLPTLPSLAEVEKLVPSILNRDEDTMAVLRIAARLYLLFKSWGLIDYGRKSI